VDGDHGLLAPIGIDDRHLPLQNYEEVVSLVPLPKEHLPSPGLPPLATRGESFDLRITQPRKRSITVRCLGERA
jgi:hypothetical protein